MKKLLLVTSLSFAFIASSAALAVMPPKPANCPGVTSLQGSKWELAQQDKDGTWVTAVVHNNYDTPEAWTFVMGKITAKGQRDAMKKAAGALKSLTFQTGPVAIEQYNVWACGYQTAEGYPAVSVTPALGIRGMELLK